MRDAIDRVLAYAEPGCDAFMADPMRQDAIIRNLEIAGEAAKRVPDNIRDLAPEIPWRQMAGTRDKLAHDYFGVDLDLVWDVVAKGAAGYQGTTTCPRRKRFALAELEWPMGISRLRDSYPLQQSFDPPLAGRWLSGGRNG